MIIYFKMLTREPRLEEIPRGAWVEYYRYHVGNTWPMMWMMCSAVEQFYGAGSGYFKRERDNETEVLSDDA